VLLSALATRAPRSQRPDELVSSLRVESGGGDDLIGLQEVNVPITAAGGDGTGA